MDPITAGVGLGLGAVAKGATAINSYRAQKRLEKQLKDLEAKPLDEYKADPALKQAYSQALGEASSPEGFTGSQLGAYRQRLAQMRKARLSSARNMTGGSSGRAINAVLGGQELNALNDMATKDASLALSNRNAALGRTMSLGGQFQNIRNMNTQTRLNRRLMQEQALGQSIRSQRDMRLNMLQGLGGDLITAGAMGLGDLGGGVEDIDAEVVGSTLNTNSPSLNYKGTFGNNVNADLISRRNRLRKLGAYNNRSFDFSTFDDGSPVRIR